MTSKFPAAQVGASKKAAAVKAANEAKRPQPLWLQPQNLTAAADIVPPLDPERVSAAHRPQGPPRLLSKAEVIAITHATYPTIWQWMRDGKFPRSRIVGGKSMWLSVEVDAWLTNLPTRRLKGDAPTEVA